MNPTLKKLLIVFSVCLNIGFIAMSAQHMLRRPPDGPGRGLDRIERIVRDVDFRADEKAKLLDLVREFHGTMREMDEERHRNMHQAMELLKAPGELDSEALAENRRRSTAMHERMDILIQEHLARIRRELGPDRARLFFQALEDRFDRPGPR